MFERFFGIVFVAGMMIVGGCSASHTSSSSSHASDTAEKPVLVTEAKPEVRFSIYMRVTASEDHPADELFIDTSGEMRFNTHQQMKTGQWKTPEGFAYVEPADADTLHFFMKHDSFLEIQPGDILPQCPGGDQLYIAVYRADLKKNVRYKTNMCAATFNLLTGEQRTLFPMFLNYMERLRNRYRPRFPD